MALLLILPEHTLSLHGPLSTRYSQQSAPPCSSLISVATNKIPWQRITCVKKDLLELLSPCDSPSFWGSQGRSVQQAVTSQSQSRAENSEYVYARLLACLCSAGFSTLKQFRILFPGNGATQVGWVSPYQWIELDNVDNPWLNPSFQL